MTAAIPKPAPTPPRAAGRPGLSRRLDGQGAPGAGAPAITVRGKLTQAEAQDVLGLVRAATEQDGVGPLSEHVMLHLRYGGDPRARNLLLTSNGEVAGYAHLDPTDPVEGPSGELVIHPAHRGDRPGPAAGPR